MNIVIIGMRGAGKSNVSRRLSVLSKRQVFSTDTMIEYESGGKSIDDIIAHNNGDWRAFRDLEYDVVSKVSKMEDCIIDCGGGVIVDLNKKGVEVFSDRKIKALKKNGVIIWLKGDIKKLVEKVEKKANRPTLDLRTSNLDLMEHRKPFYEKAADVVIEIGDKRRQIIADEIFEMLEQGKLKRA